MSGIRRAVAGLAGLALAGGACLGGIAAAPVAGAASAACGRSCSSLYNQKFGTADVSAVSGGTAAPGQAVILAVEQGPGGRGQRGQPERGHDQRARRPDGRPVGSRTARLAAGVRDRAVGPVAGVPPGGARLASVKAPEKVACSSLQNGLVTRTPP